VVNCIAILVSLVCGALYTAHSKAYTTCQSIDLSKRSNFHANRIIFFFGAFLSIISLFITTQPLNKIIPGYWNSIDLSFYSNAVIPVGGLLFITGLTLNIFRFLSRQKASSTLDRLSLGMLISGMGIAAVYTYPLMHAEGGLLFSPIAGLVCVIFFSISIGGGLLLSLSSEAENKILGNGLTLFATYMLKFYAGLLAWNFAMTEMNLSSVMSFISVLGVFTLLHLAS